MPITDRLPDMQKLSKGSRKSSEKEKMLKDKDAKKCQQFHESLYRIKDEITNLEREIHEVHALHMKLLSQPPSPALTKETNKKTDDVHAKLRSLMKELKVLRKTAESVSDTPANKIIYRNQVNGLVQSIASMLEKFNYAQIEYKEKNRKKLENYLRVLDSNLPEDAFENALEEGTLSIHLNRATLGVAQKEALQEVKQRSADIQAIEKSIRDLAEMFQDLDMLVRSQGDMVDNIGLNVGKTVDYAENASKEIRQALKLKRKARKLKIILVIGGIILAVVVITVVVAAIF